MVEILISLICSSQRKKFCKKPSLLVLLSHWLSIDCLVSEHWLLLWLNDYLNIIKVLPKGKRLLKTRLGCILYVQHNRKYFKSRAEFIFAITKL